MTTADLSALLAADLSDAATRLVLADALAEAGRDVEAAIARTLSLPVESDGKRLLADLSGDEPDSNEGGDGEIGEDRAGWINTRWGKHRVGGCWIYSAASAHRENERLGLTGGGAYYPGAYDAGKCVPYEGDEMGDLSDAIEACGLDSENEDIRKEMAQLIQRASAREGERTMEEYRHDRGAGRVGAAIRHEYSLADGLWTGCDWSTGNDYIDDLDGLSAEDASAASASAEAEGDDEAAAGWRKAAEYLSRVEADAAAADAAALSAVEAAEAGDFAAAVREAERAADIERAHGDCPVWGPFRDAVREIIGVEGGA